MKKLFAFIILSAFLINSCNDSEIHYSYYDSDGKIEIISITPDSGLVNGNTYDFITNVSYTFSTPNQCELQIGFNNGDGLNTFYLIKEAKKIVDNGIGYHTFNVTTAAKDWGIPGSFKVMVILSGHPHSSGWDPIDNVYYSLYFQ